MGVTYAKTKYLNKITDSTAYVDVSDIIDDINSGRVNSKDTLDFSLNKSRIAITVPRLGEEYTFTLRIGGTTKIYSQFFPLSYPLANPEYVGVNDAGNMTFAQLLSYANSNGRLQLSISCPTAVVAFDYEYAYVFRTYNIPDVTYPTPTGITLSSQYIDKNIVVTSSPSTTSIMTILKNAEGSVVGTYVNNTSNTVTIPGGTISDLSTTYSIEAKNGITFSGFDSKYSGTYTKTGITFTVENPTLTNLTTTGDFWESPISVSWLATNQTGYEYSLYSNNVLVKSGTGGTEKSFTIPAKTFTSALNPRISIRNYRTYNGVKYYSSYVDRSLTLKDITATVTSLLLEGELWEQPIKVSWQSTNQQQFKLEVLKSNVVVKTYTGTTATSYTIPNSQLSVGVHTFRVTVAYANRYVNSTERSVTLKDIVATVSNLTIEGALWEKPILLYWQSVNQQQFRVDVLRSSEIVKTYTGTTATSYTIPVEHLTEGAHTIRVTVGYANRYVNSAERSVTLMNIIPTVTDLVISGSNIDLDLSFSWLSAEQQKYEIEILKDVSIVKTYAGTTSTSVLIPHSTLTTGLHNFRIRVAFKDRWTAWKEYTVTLTETLPSIGAFEPDGVITERDNPIRIWWTSQNQSKWNLIIDESTTYTGTIEKEKMLPPGVLQTGKHSITITVTYITALGIEKHVTKKAEWIVQGKPPIPTITSADSFLNSRPLIIWDTQDQQGYILEILKDNVITYSTDWKNGLITEHKIMNYLDNGIYTVRVKVKNQFSLESDYGTKQITVIAQESTQVTLKAIRVENSIRLTWDNLDNSFIKFYIVRNGEVIAKTTGTSYLDHTAFGECIYTIRGITATDVYKDSNNAYTECTIRNGLMSTVNRLDDLINVGISRNEFNFDGSVDLSSTQVMLNGRELPVTIFGEHSLNTFNINFTSKELFRFIEMCKRRKTFLYRDKRQKLYLSITNPSYKIDSLGLQYSVQATEVDYKEVIQYD